MQRAKKTKEHPSIVMKFSLFISVSDELQPLQHHDTCNIKMFYIACVINKSLIGLERFNRIVSLYAQHDVK